MGFIEEEIPVKVADRGNAQTQTPSRQILLNTNQFWIYLAV